MKVQPSGVKTRTRETEQRRSQRVLLVIPVEVRWTLQDGVRVTEHAETEEVNAHGALLRMKTQLRISTEMEVSRPRTHQSAKAKVVALRGGPGAGNLYPVAIELSVSSETFWGVSIPPLPGKRSSPTTERRKYLRVRLFTVAQIESPTIKATSLGRTEKLSASGLRLLSRDTFDPQTSVYVRFKLPTGRHIETQGIVVHAQRGLYMGIQFLGLKDEDRNAINEFVQQSV